MVRPCQGFVVRVVPRAVAAMAQQPVRLRRPVPLQIAKHSTVAEPERPMSVIFDSKENKVHAVFAIDGIFVLR